MMNMLHKTYFTSTNLKRMQLHTWSSFWGPILKNSLYSSQSTIIETMLFKLYIFFVTCFFWKSNQVLANPYSRLDLHAIETEHKYWHVVCSICFYYCR
jgi:hypothetical protein